jgi:hypothetical protein
VGAFLRIPSSSRVNLHFLLQSISLHAAMAIPKIVLTITQSKSIMETALFITKRMPCSIDGVFKSVLQRGSTMQDGRESLA